MTPSRREFVKSLAAGSAVLAGLPLSVASGQLRRPPNVVLVFTDDQGYGDVGVYGARGFVTPNLDRLAAEGIRFTDFYVSQAVCSASRASLLTGCYAERVSIRGALGPRSPVGLNPDETTIAEMLRPLGYATGAFGKWHLGDAAEFLPPRHGFDEYFGLPYSNDMWPVDYDGRPAAAGRAAAYPPLPLIEGERVVETVDDLAAQGRLTTRYTERAVAFIERHAGRPFFLYVPHSMPHVPLAVSERFRGRSAQGLYGDVIEELDWSVGQLLGALDRHGLAADTLFLFTSDNGPWLSFGDHAGSTGGLREGKGTAFEGGARVPAIMRWPGRIRPGTVSRRIASTIDILPTIAAVTGAALPPLPIDGVSILPLLAGDGGAPPRNVFLYYYGGELRAVREGRWKRVFPHTTTSYEGQPAGHDGHPGPSPTRQVPAALYDLEADVGETRDVAERHPFVLARLEAIAEEARARLGDALTDRVGAEVRPPGRARFDRPDTLAHAGVGAHVTLATRPSPQYPGGGAGALTDGRLGTKDHADGRWLGFRGHPLDAVVDLGVPRAVRSVSVDCLRDQQAWIFLPFRIELSVSLDREHWEVVARREEPVVRSDTIVARSRSVPAPGRPVRYLRVVAHPVDPLPAWHAGAGQPGWVFVDEIIVEA